ETSRLTVKRKTRICGGIGSLVDPPPCGLGTDSKLVIAPNDSEIIAAPENGASGRTRASITAAETAGDCIAAVIALIAEGLDSDLVGCGTRFAEIGGGFGAINSICCQANCIDDIGAEKISVS